MTSQQSGSVRWRQTTVILRSDIFDSAKSQGIDISSECNQALAARMGIDYSQQKIPEHPENPVIIAKEGAAGTGGIRDGTTRKQLHPVLNAEDPSARAHLLKMKKEPVVREKTVPSPVPAEMPEEPARTVAGEPVKNHAKPAPEHHAAGKKPGAKMPQKKGKDDLIRRFITRQILRTEPGSGEPDRIPKDDLYPLFVRWCKENAGKGGTVPDKRAFTVALKNRFAMEDGVEDGVRSWKNVKLR